MKTGPTTWTFTSHPPRWMIIVVQQHNRELSFFSRSSSLSPSSLAFPGNLLVFAPLFFPFRLQSYKKMAPRDGYDTDAVAAAL